MLAFLMVFVFGSEPSVRKIFSKKILTAQALPSRR
jgi:hypothetical protein